MGVQIFKRKGARNAMGEQWERKLDARESAALWIIKVTKIEPERRVSATATF
jgi:hypothetical protein